MCAVSIIERELENIRWQADGSILVPSRSEPGFCYTVESDYKGHLTCACIGFYWYDLCRHIETAAHMLENHAPKTIRQAEVFALTYNDPARLAFRNGATIGNLPRNRRDWNE